MLLTLIFPQSTVSVELYLCYLINYQLTGLAKDCAWYGAAPICNAKCPAGTNESRRDSYGDGKCCRTGSKVLCCS